MCKKDNHFFLNPPGNNFLKPVCTWTLDHQCQRRWEMGGTDRERRFGFHRAVDSWECWWLRERDKPRSSNVRVCENVQWRLSRLFPEVHDCTVLDRGRSAKPWSVCCDYGWNWRSRCTQESRHSQTQGYRSQTDPNKVKWMAVFIFKWGDIGLKR